MKIDKQTIADAYARGLLMEREASLALATFGFQEERIRRGLKGLGPDTMEFLALGLAHVLGDSEVDRSEKLLTAAVARAKELLQRPNDGQSRIHHKYREVARVMNDGGALGNRVSKNGTVTPLVKRIGAALKKLDPEGLRGDRDAWNAAYTALKAVCHEP